MAPLRSNKPEMKYDNWFEYDENLIKVTSYEVLGKLPEILKTDDGSYVKCPDEWPARRAQIAKYVIDLQYGTQPPAPEVFKAEPTCIAADKYMNYRITAGSREKQAVFMMKIILPAANQPHFEKIPVVVCGDLCWLYSHDKEWLDAFLSRGIAVCLFDRTSLASDCKATGRSGPLYEIYPDKTFGALGAWAWGYSRCVDAISEIGCFDMDFVAFTGHSRGAKTAMLAGALDERAKIVNPNETNAGSCSCYRIHMKAITEDGDEKPGEKLSNILTNFPYWFGEGMKEYALREQDLPFDCHFLKAMIAPRYLLIGEAASDIWTNPIGSWQTSCAASEFYKWMGVPDRIRWYFRKGYHAHSACDVDMLANFIAHIHHGEPLLEGRCFRTPFKQPEKIY